MHHAFQTGQNFSQCTTQMLRVALSGMQKPASLWKKIVSVAWLIGASLIILLYLLLPLLILFHQVFKLMLEVLLTGNIFLIVELVISYVLLRIARPARIPSALAGRDQQGRRVHPAALPVIRTPQAIPTTPAFVPDSLSALRTGSLSSLPRREVFSQAGGRQV